MRLLTIVGLLLLSGCDPPSLRLSIDDVELKKGSVHFELTNHSNHTVSEINFEIVVTKPGEPAEVASMTRVIEFPLGLAPKASKSISVRLDDRDFNSLLENGSAIVVNVRNGICSGFTNVSIQSFTSSAKGKMVLRDYEVKPHNKRVLPRGEAVQGEK